MSTVGTEEIDSPPAKKSVGAFISQGAGGGAISIFLLMLLTVFRHPNGYNFLLIPYLPFILLIGSVLGATGGILIWLIQAILKLRSWGFIPSAAIVGLITSILVGSGFHDGSPIGIDLLLTSLVAAGVIVLPISILTSWNIELWRLVLFGSNRVAASGVHSMLAAFALRVGSLAGLLISLFFFAWWGSFLSVDWGVRLQPYYITFGILYFAASSYFGFRPPPRRSLIIATLLLNVPLMVWALTLRPLVDPDTKFLAGIAFVFVGLWVIFVACLLFDRRFNSWRENQRPIDMG